VFAAWIEAAGSAIDLAGVFLIAIGFLFASGRYIINVFSATEDSYRRFRQDVGRAILLGLEVLVAADIIRTVAITPTLVSVAVLAGIVLIRTFEIPVSAGAGEVIDSSSQCTASHAVKCHMLSSMVLYQFPTPVLVQPPRQLRTQRPQSGK
jgi:uncharacterized membrane protein